MNYFTLLAANPPMDNKTAATIFICALILTITHIISSFAGASLEANNSSNPSIPAFVMIMIVVIATVLGALITILVNIFQ